MQLVVVLTAVPGQRAALAEYEDQVLALLPRYGGRLVHRYSVESGDAAEVHVLELPDEAALEALLADPDRLALNPLRDTCVSRTELLRVREV